MIIRTIRNTFIFAKGISCQLFTIKLARIKCCITKKGLSFSNFSWQSVKISAKESCLYGIIDVRITPFLDVWFIVSRQLYYTISGEGLFVFCS